MSYKYEIGVRVTGQDVTALNVKDAAHFVGLNIVSISDESSMMFKVTVKVESPVSSYAETYFYDRLNKLALNRDIVGEITSVKHGYLPSPF